MLRFIAITALAAGLSFPAFAEPGFVQTASLPALGLSSGAGPKAACELPASLSVAVNPVLPTASHAMTLSPRMLQALRIDDGTAIH